MGAVIIIPARFQASRFPGKPLAPLAGKPMIQWVYERCAQVENAQVMVATDDRRIFSAVRKFGGDVVMTRSDHDNGTQRIAEVAERLDARHIINVQGDEPLIEPDAVRLVLEMLESDSSLEMATLAEPVSERASLFNPNVVKVVCNQKGDALYFSRSPIPFIKHPRMERIDWPEDLTAHHLRHVGIYGYRRDFLIRFASEPACDLEQVEGLEQLRALYMGVRIRVGITTMQLVGVDTPDDLVRAECLIRGRSLP
ncbi:MAG: 3-deoxy-manno-octulosonate cytidylyltransferase [Acidobacteria bacterium]|nr:3-deoxy-manno-octulosonate cytidylyltransferase [Acidobacteriota bacterium]